MCDSREVLPTHPDPRRGRAHTENYDFTAANHPPEKQNATRSGWRSRGIRGRGHFLGSSTFGSSIVFLPSFSPILPVTFTPSRSAVQHFEWYGSLPPLSEM